MLTLFRWKSFIWRLVYFISWSKYFSSLFHACLRKFVFVWILFTKKQKIQKKYKNKRKSFVAGVTWRRRWRRNSSWCFQKQIDFGCCVFIRIRFFDFGYNRCDRTKSSGQFKSLEYLHRERVYRLPETLLIQLEIHKNSACQRKIHLSKLAFIFMLFYNRKFEAVVVKLPCTKERILFENSYIFECFAKALESQNGVIGEFAPFILPFLVGSKSAIFRSQHWPQECTAVERVIFSLSLKSQHVESVKRSKKRRILFTENFKILRPNKRIRFTHFGSTKNDELFRANLKLHIKCWNHANERLYDIVFLVQLDIFFSLLKSLHWILLPSGDTDSQLKNSILRGRRRVGTTWI